MRSESLIELFNQLLNYGGMPEPVDPEVAAGLEDDRVLSTLVRQMGVYFQFITALSKGDLTVEMKEKGRYAGALKALQAHLRHLTWQTLQVTKGDFSQRVNFMGDFATAFNQMVETLKQNKDTLEQRARELDEQRLMAVRLMEEAQHARDQLQEANLQLHLQLDENQKLQAQLSEQAIRDMLTGLYNRRFMEETLERELARAVRENTPVSIVMLDIDRFKKLNDQYGHPAGDQVLRSLGQLLLSTTRRGDVPCRYGGEEFLMISPKQELANAVARAEILRENFAALRFESQSSTFSATFSAGVACFPENGVDAHRLLLSADEALYNAKAAGRNCIISARIVAAASTPAVHRYL